MVNENLPVGDPNRTRTLALTQTGKFLRLSATGLKLKVDLTSAGFSPAFELQGDFAFEQITLPDSNPNDAIPAPKVIRIGANNVNATVLGVTVSDGQGAFIFLPAGSVGQPTGIAGQLSLTLQAGNPGAGFAAGGDIVLRINTTNRGVNETISVGSENIAIKFGDGTNGTPNEKYFVGFAILNASIEFPPFFKLSGDFTTQSSGNETIYGARNVELFLGFVPDGGSHRDANGRHQARCDRYTGHQRNLGRGQARHLDAGPQRRFHRGLRFRPGRVDRRARPDAQRDDHGAHQQHRPGDRQDHLAADRSQRQRAGGERRPRQQRQRADRRGGRNRVDSRALHDAPPRRKSSKPASTKRGISAKTRSSRSAPPTS